MGPEESIVNVIALLIAHSEDICNGDNIKYKLEVETPKHPLEHPNVENVARNVLRLLQLFDFTFGEINKQSWDDPGDQSVDGQSN